MKYVRLLVLFVLLFFAYSFAFPKEAYAISNPTNITVLDTFAFPSALESGDMVFFMRYKLGYSSAPVEMPETVFELQVRDPTGAVIYGTGYVYYYGENIATVYFTPTQVTSLGLTSGAAYLFRITGKALLAPLVEGLNMVTHTMVVGDYLSSTSIQSTMLGQATRLQSNLGVTLLVSGRLNTLGAQYFNLGFPNLYRIVPDLFSVVKVNPDLSYRNWTENYTASLATHRGPMLEGIVTDIGVNLFHMTYNAAAIWLAVMAYLFVASFVYPVVKNAGWTLIIAFPVPVTAAWLGIADPMLRVVTLVVMGVAFVFGLYFILGKFA